MFDRRTFLFGLGSGIIIGALLFKLFEIGESSEANLQKISNELNASEPTVQATAAADNSSPPVAITLTVSESPPREIEPTPSAAKSDKNQGGTGEGADIEEDSFMVRIEAGLKLEEAAKVLEDSKVIADADAFTARMLELDKPVRAGYYVFHQGISLEEVITSVTSSPLSEEEVQHYRQEHPDGSKLE